VEIRGLAAAIAGGASGMARATAELLGLEAARSASLRSHIVQRFIGPDYGWMWPFERTVQAWYDRALENLSGVTE